MVRGPAGKNLSMTERPAVFRQLYLVTAVLAVAASFAPLWVPADGDEGSDIGTYSLWTVIPADGGGAALLGVVLILALAGVAVAASALPTLGRAVPVTLFVLAVVAALVLVAKPNTGEPTPVFGPGAGLLFGTALTVAVTAVADLLVSFRIPEPVERRSAAGQYQP